MRTCTVHNCDYPVFGTDKRTGKGLCKGHQFLRTDKAKEKRKPVREAKAVYRSLKRMREEAEYQKVCDEIDKELQEVGEFRCFFTNKPLPVDRKPAHHHLRGRVGKLLTDKRWIVPCKSSPHLNYHDLSVEKLSKKSWYPGFLKRLREVDEGLYQKELNKKDKS